MNVRPERDGFDGVWQMYLPDSKVLDPVTKEWVPELIKDQVSEIRHDGDAVDFRSRVDHADDLSLYRAYSCRYGADEWAPYRIVHIEGDPEHESLRPNHFCRHHARVGGVMGYVKDIYVDPLTRVRVTRHPTGEASCAMPARIPLGRWYDPWRRERRPSLRFSSRPTCSASRRTLSSSPMAVKRRASAHLGPVRVTGCVRRVDPRRAPGA